MLSTVADIQGIPRLPFRRDAFRSGFTLSNALAIFDATECAVCSSFLSAITEAPQTQTSLVPVYVPDICWPQHLAEHDASASYSAACYQKIEHIRIFPVIVAKGELGEVERQILLRHMVEASHDATFEQRPEGLNAIRMDDTAYIFIVALPDNLMRIFSLQITVCRLGKRLCRLASDAQRERVCRLLRSVRACPSR
jgi:hypothetical protein